MADRSVNQNLTQAQVQKALDYEPDTGVLRWRWRDDVAPHINSKFAGTEAGCIHRASTGHMKVCLNGASYFVHRIIWLHVTGAWPDMIIDHIDGNPRNNAWSNLRQASYTQNGHNQKATRKIIPGLKGARWHKHTGKWQASIRVNGTPKYLGVFATEQAAHDAYCAAAKLHFGEFANFG